MRITRLKATRRGDRVNVYIDNEFAFSVEMSIITDRKLYVGKKLTESEIAIIQEKDTIKNGYKKALRLIQRRPRSEQEIVRYLKDKYYKIPDSQEIITTLIALLTKRGHIDDKKFATWWIQNRIACKPRGKILLRQELRSKGINKQIIREVLQEQEIGSEKEYTMAYTLGKKKKRILGDLHDTKKRNKFIRYLLRKGFTYDVVMRVLKNL